MNLLRYLHLSATQVKQDPKCCMCKASSEVVTDKEKRRSTHVTVGIPKNTPSCNTQTIALPQTDILFKSSLHPQHPLKIILN